MKNDQQIVALLYEGDFCYAQVPVECDVDTYREYVEKVARDYSVVDFRVEFVVESDLEV